MAAAKAVEIKRALALGKRYVPDDLKFVDVLQAAIKNHIQVERLKPNTERTFRMRAAQIIRHFRDRGFASVGVQDIRSLYNTVESQGKIATLKRHNQILEITYKYAIKQGYVVEAENHLLAVGYDANYKKYTKNLVKHHEKLTDLESLQNFLEKLCLEDESQASLIVASIFIMVTGMRVNSVENLKWSYFSKDLATLKYPKQLLKGEAATESQREDLILPLAPKLREILLKFRETINPKVDHEGDYMFSRKEKPIAGAQISTFIKKISDGRITAHGLRGTFATWTRKRWSEHQVPMIFIRLYLHQKLSTDEIMEAYTEIHYSDLEVQEQLMKLGTWYCDFLNSQYDFVTPVLKKLY